MKIIRCMTAFGSGLRWTSASADCERAGSLMSYKDDRCIQTVAVSRNDARDLGQALLEAVGVPVLKQSAPKPDPAFWIVWCPNGPNNPTHRHNNETSARTEAARLAKAHPGKCYYPLPCGEYAHAEAKVTWEHEREIPF